MNKKLWLLLITLLLVVSSFSNTLVRADVYTYMFEGPYYDDGTVPNNGQTTVTLYYANGTAYSFSLQASGTTPAGVTLYSTVRIEQATWNASALNETRMFTYLGTAADEDILYIRVMDPDQAYYAYTFSVADFYGMTNPFIESAVGYGTNLPIERQSLNTTGVVTFLLTQHIPYRIIFRCTQGVYIQPFTPGATTTVNLQVLAGAFPSTVTNASVTTTVRTNATTIDITYVDSDEVTDWLYIEITHQDGAYLITDATDNQTSTNSYTLTATVDNETDYFVQVQAYRYGGITEWDFACPVLTLTNPFTGLLDFLGTWPTGFDPAQLFAAAIIMCGLGLGSFRSAGVSCVLAWILTGIFVAIGWFTIGIPMFAFAGVISIIVVLTEGKETTRDA